MAAEPLRAPPWPPTGPPALPSTRRATLRDAGLAFDDRRQLAAALDAYRELGVPRRVAELEARLGPDGAGASESTGVFRREGGRVDDRVWRHDRPAEGREGPARHGLPAWAARARRGGRRPGGGAGRAPPGRPGRRRSTPPPGTPTGPGCVELDVELERADAAGDGGRGRPGRRTSGMRPCRPAGGRLRARPPVPVGRRRRERARQAATWRIRDALGRIERFTRRPSATGTRGRSGRTWRVPVYYLGYPVDGLCSRPSRRARDFLAPKG